jgi:hypothetical protein
MAGHAGDPGSNGRLGAANDTDNHDSRGGADAECGTGGGDGLL